MDLEGTGGSVILNTIAKDTYRSTDDAFEAIYRVMRASEAPDMEAAHSLLEKLFFNQKRYDLGLVGPYSFEPKASRRRRRNSERNHDAYERGYRRDLEVSHSFATW